MDRIKQKFRVFRTGDHDSDEDEGVEYSEDSIEKRKQRFEDDENESGSKDKSRESVCHETNAYDMFCLNIRCGQEETEIQELSSEGVGPGGGGRG